MTDRIPAPRTLVFLLAAWMGVASIAYAQESWTLLPHISTSGDTGEKPQSKTWFHAHTWWTVLAHDSASPVGPGTWLSRLEPNGTWTHLLQLSTSNTRADVKVVGDVAHVLLENSSPRLVSVEYVPASHTYQLWSARPTPTFMYVGETGTIDVDSTGRMWLATEFNNDVEVYYSDYPYSSFSGPIVLANTINSDDIAAVTALPNNSIGVLWSNQNTKRFGFRVHEDGTDPAVWLADEVPASQSAMDEGLGMADDHINLAVATDGTLYAAVKTGFSGSLPTIALLVRRPNASGLGGTWDDLHFVDSSGTRPIVLLNEDTQTVRVFFTSGGSVFFRESPVSTIDFGPQQEPMSGGLNNVTGPKDPWAGRLVIFATNGDAASVLLTTTPGLVGYWKMEEGGGTQLQDMSGWGNDADLAGSPSWVPGVIGQAIDFDGATSYATVSDQAALDVTTGLTLAAWIKPEVRATQDLISRAIFNSADGYALSLSPSDSPISPGTVYVQFNQATFGNVYRMDSATQYPFDGDTWMHVAATYDGDTMRLYINGVEENSAAGPVQIFDDDVDVGVGAQGDGARRFKGHMDEVRIYDRALTEEEIGTLVGMSPPEADLAITKSDFISTVNPGQAVTYTIQVSNLGPDDVPAATVLDALPAELTGATWTCTPTAGSTCSANGSGGINDIASLVAGGGVTYTLQATVAAGATGTLTNTATVEALDVDDPEPDNNSATDVDTIVVIVAPQITTQPVDATVAAPSPAVFSVAASGTSPLSYQWRRDGEAIPGATGTSYIINPTALADDGAEFDVVVSNAAGSATSVVATLTVTTSGGGSVNKSLVSPTTRVPTSVVYDDQEGGDENGVAVWVAPDPNDSLLFVAQKVGDVVHVWNLQTNQIVRTLTGFDQPVGVAVDRHEAALYVTNENGEAIHKYFIADIVTGNLSPALVFAVDMEPADEPSGVTVNHRADGTSLVYATFGGTTTKVVRAFTTNGVLQHSWNIGPVSVNSIVADDENQRIYLTDRSNHLIKVYQLDGTFVQNFGQANFGSSSKVDGLAVYRCGNDGYIFASDEDENEFEVFDRLTFAHLATFSIEGAQETVGVAVVQEALPGYPLGALFVESDEKVVFGVRWDVLAGALGASTCVPSVPVPPSILAPPEDVTVTEPEAAAFTVVASGDAPLAHQWRRDGVDIPGATAATYVLDPTAVATDDGATFDVVVSNNAGEVTSAAATLTVNPAPVPPSITTPPDDVTVTEPTAAGFTVLAIGDAPLTYQWRQDGIDIPGATSSAYALDPTAVSDDGAQFDVVVANGAGQVTSAVATLTVNPAPVPPSIITPPSNAMVTEPDAAAFTVVATGDAPLTYEWRRDGIDIPGATSATYILDPTVVADDGAEFYVVVSNGAGQAATEPVTLTVNPAPVPPSITTEPSDLTVTEPDAAAFTVVATGDAPLGYQWRRDGIDIPGATAATYVLDPTAVAIDDGATFDVVVSNGAGQDISVLVTLTVDPAPGPPSITTEPSDQTVTEPDAAAFTVVATGDAPLTYQWRRDGIDIPGATAATYVLDPTAVADDGATFDVVVSNGAGQATSAVATLMVNPAPVPPSITTEPSDLTLTEPDAATFTVVATGDAPLTYQWRRDGVDLPGATSATYVLMPTAALADNGATFDVVVSNGAGQDISVLVTLTVNPAPVPPSITTEPSDQTVTEPDAATFTVVATGDAPLTYQWRRDGVDLPGATSATYVLDPTALATDHGATFDVVVSNGAGQATSAVAALTVNGGGGGDVNKDLISPTTPVPHAVVYDDGLRRTEASVAVWVAPDPSDSLLFVTQKKGNVVDVWSLETNQIVYTLTGFDRPVGVAVDQNEAAVYVSNERLESIFKYFIADILSGNLTPALVLGTGMSPSAEPQGIAVYHGASGTRLYVAYMGSAEKFVRAFDTNGVLQLSWSMGSIGIHAIAADSENNRIFVADKTNNVIKAYQPDGTFIQDFGQVSIGADSDVEEFSIYRCGADGYIIASDQGVSEFEVFDRITLAHLATFQIASTSKTIGMAVAQAALPGYPGGALFTQSDGKLVLGTRWDVLGAATGMSTCAAP